MAIPAHAEALRAMGAPFLTAAFRRFGALAADNSVTRITGMAPCPGGSTGAKLFLSVEYARARPGLPTELFVKFSRDFTDERRDRQRDEMAGEARFAPITRMPGFPIAVPAALFADYHGASETGLVITARVTYGENGIEPHRRKCLDHLHTPEPLPYYRAIVTALARLAGAHKAGKLGADIEARFPFDPVAASADPVAFDAAQLEVLLDQCADYAKCAPQLLVPEVCTADFLDQMRRDARRIFAAEGAIQRHLRGNHDLIALCHWNAHIDNAWFWREGGALHCGLIDWGRVGQISFGAALWGGLCAAPHAIWEEHLDELLALFVAEYRASGGPAISAAALLEHLTLHMALMGVSRVLAFPEIIRFRLPQAVTASGAQDPMFESVDAARNCVHVYSVWVRFWQRRGFGWALDRLGLQ